MFMIAAAADDDDDADDVKIKDFYYDTYSLTTV